MKRMDWGDVAAAIGLAMLGGGCALESPAAALIVVGAIVFVWGGVSSAAGAKGTRTKGVDR